MASYSFDSTDSFDSGSDDDRIFTETHNVIKMFEHLLKTQKEFSVMGKKFNPKYYARKGYSFNTTLQTIRFINLDNKTTGILMNENEIIIWHTGTMLENDDDAGFLKICATPFREPNTKTSRDHIKIWLYHSVFESWVHDGTGFIIEKKYLVPYLKNINWGDNNDNIL